MLESRTARNELRLLVELCRRHEGTPGGRPPLLAGGDVPAGRGLIEAACRHQVLGLALSTLPDVAAENREVLRDLRRRAALLESKRDRVLEVLDRAGIAAVVLKGAALAGALYPRPWERDQQDLDLLVREDRVRPAARALASAGYRIALTTDRLWRYRRRHFHIPMVGPTGHLVELHWGLVAPASPFRLDPRPVLEQAVTIGAAGAAPVRCPRPEHMLLHLAVQNLQERFSRLARLVDIDRIVTSTEGLDWDLLVRTARSGNLASTTALSLRLAAALLGTEVPDRVDRELRPSTAACLHLAMFRPVSSLLRQRFLGALSARHLLNVWLFDRAPMRWGWLPRIVDTDSVTALGFTDGVGAAARAVRLAKLAVFQLFVYSASLIGLGTGRGRAQMRFWSNHASSSDRL